MKQQTLFVSIFQLSARITFADFFCLTDFTVGVRHLGLGVGSGLCDEDLQRPLEDIVLKGFENWQDGGRVCAAASFSTQFYLLSLHGIIHLSL